MTLPLMSAAASETRKAIVSATSAGSATWKCVPLDATNSRTGSVTHPVSVTGRMDHVGGDAEVAQLQRGGHRVVGLRRLRRAVGDLFGEAEFAARGEPDDPAPAGAAFAAAPGELGDQQSGGHGVDGELTGATSPP